jgi:hypothetical protein
MGAIKALEGLWRAGAYRSLQEPTRCGKGGGLRAAWEVDRQGGRGEGS